MNSGGKIFRGLAWSAIERVSIQAVQYILGIILARLLTPKEYGIVGILMVFIIISQVFIDSGFTKALIQKQERTDSDISTVFIFNLVISVICYSVLWIASPWIASFYEIEELDILLKVLSITLITQALYAVPITLKTINLDFKSLTKINFSATVLSGSIAVYMAYKGLGIWALVAQSLINSSTTAILAWVFTNWTPKPLFSWVALKKLFKFGSNLLISSVISAGVNNLYALFVAKLMSPRDLGYYTRGTQFANAFYAIIDTSLGNVLLPGFSEFQTDLTKLISHTRIMIKATALLIVPFFIFLTIIAEPLISTLLTDKWLPAVPIMQIFCIARMITIISGINVNLLYVIGRTDLALRQQVGKLLIRVTLLVIAINYGIVFIALAELISTISHFFINAYYPGKIMKYGSFSQLNDLRFIILSGIIMGILSYFSMQLVSDDITKLFVALLFSGISYFTLIKVFKITELKLIISKSKEFLRSL